MAPSASVFSSYGIFNNDDTALLPRILPAAVFEQGVVALEGDLPGHRLPGAAAGQHPGHHPPHAVGHTVDRQALTPRTPQARPLESLHGVLASMQQLRTSFATIIMPEGLNSFLQEASVLEVGKRVEEIVASCGVSLEEVVAEIRLHTKCIMLGMDLPDLATV